MPGRQRRQPPSLTPPPPRRSSASPGASSAAAASAAPRITDSSSAALRAAAIMGRSLDAPPMPLTNRIACMRMLCIPILKLAAASAYSKNAATRSAAPRLRYDPRESRSLTCSNMKGLPMAPSLS